MYKIKYIELDLLNEMVIMPIKYYSSQMTTFMVIVICIECDAFDEMYKIKYVE